MGTRFLPHRENSPLVVVYDIYKGELRISVSLDPIVSMYSKLQARLVLGSLMLL